MGRDPPTGVLAHSIHNVMGLGVEDILYVHCGGGDALSVHMVLSLGYVGLLFRICGCCNIGLVRRVGCVLAALHLTPLLA